MINRSAGNNKYLKEYNRMHILDLVREHKALSKIQLSGMTGLSPTACGTITAELIGDGYLHETSKGASRGGRRPGMLELKPGSYFSAGIDFDIDYMDLVLLDITGDVMADKTCSISGGWQSPGEAASCMVSMIDAAIEESGCIRKGMRFIGIGVSVPGLVDTVNSRIVMAPNLGWNDVSLKELFAGCGEKYKDMPVYLENESMATAVYENWSGSCRKIDNFICVNIKSGIGAGVFINGKPYRGADGTAGEIGHMAVGNGDREEGIKCGCGNVGCLETMAAAGYLERKASQICRSGSLSHKGRVTMEEIAKAAREGDSVLESLLIESGRYLGIALADIINILNPKKIVIGKEFVKYADIVMDTVRETIAMKALKKPAAGVEVAVSAAGGKASVTGAALIPVKALFGR